MKFFTKAWYQAMQNSNYEFMFEIDPEAEHFSESYYRRLYRSSKEKWLSEKTELCKKLRWNFDINEEKCNFDRRYRILKQQLISNLPGEILDNVADIRVLALNRCSKSVKEMISAFVTECNYNTKKAINDYEEYELAQFQDDKPDFIGKFSFHDCVIASMRKRGNDYHLTFELDDEDTWSIRKLIFKNAVIINKERQLSGAWWLYEELHKTDTGYEACVLLDKKGLFEFSIKCDDLIIE